MKLNKNSVVIRVKPVVTLLYFIFKLLFIPLYDEDLDLLIE